MTYTSHDISGFDYVHHYVGCAKHAALYYSRLFGFRIVGYQGPETGARDRTSYLLRQNDILFAVTAALDPNHRIFDFVRRHGDGVAEISLRVANPKTAFEHAVRHGAKPVAEPTIVRDEQGEFVTAAIGVYGDVALYLINRDGYRGFLPGYQPYTGPQFNERAAGLQAIDHIVGNVPEGEMNRWAAFFEEALDFETYIHFDKGDISTQFSALVSKVVRSKNSAVKLPINEPAEGKKKSQIEEYLEVNYGSGVQHIAIGSDDIVASIGDMRERGVGFIPTPETYYDLVADRVALMQENLADVKRLGLLIDNEGDGYLLQLFTQPVGDRPTLFYEIIQRKGSDGFGQNNFQSLFESIEQEQAKRGNL